MICKFTGYHGTTKENAIEIVKVQKFNIYENNELFLGNGIYMYNEIDNALYYNIGKYKQNYNKIPSFKELDDKYSILKLDIECMQDEILNLNTYESKYNYIYAMKKINDRFKDNPEYKKIKFKDGYILNFLIKYKNQTDILRNCKIIQNIYNKDIVSKGEINQNSYIVSRIAYEVKQIYYNVIDDSCIKNIEISYNNEKDYISIEKLYSIIRSD